MASDLSPFLDEVGGCFASPFEESRSTSNQSTPSIERAIEEISNSPISLIQGDVIELQVPETMLLDYTAVGSYELRVVYAENYFGFAANTGAFRTTAETSQSGNRDMLGTSRIDPSPTLDLPITNKESIETATDASLSTNAASLDSYSMFLLASLTASRDFEGSVRVFDYANQSSLGTSNGDADRLPSEVRIEPKITAPTALRDPGPTIVKTIVVNRVSSGLAATEDAVCQSAKIVEVATLAESASTPTAPSDSPQPKQTRSVITLKTIDISQSRRSETGRSESGRPWIRSTIIPNPAHSKDFGFQTKNNAKTPVQSASIADSESEKKLNRRVEVQSSGTKLLPVEFLLAKNIMDSEQTIPIDEQQRNTTDQAVSEYMDEAERNPLESLRELGLLTAVRLQSKESEQTWTTSGKDGSEKSWNSTASLYLQSVQFGMASNKDTWKRVLRTASESTAGQMVLASLSAIAVQQGEVSAFGSKSAWEFVTKPPRSGRSI